MLIESSHWKKILKTFFFLPSYLNNNNVYTLTTMTQGFSIIPFALTVVATLLLHSRKAAAFNLAMIDKRACFGAGKLEVIIMIDQI